MDLMEYKARELYEKYRIPAMKGIIVDSLGSLSSKIEGLTFPVVVKAQVQVGGRGKAGGVKFANDSAELVDVSKGIFGMDIKGHIVKKLLIVEKAEIVKEFYLSIMLDRLTKGPMIIFSTDGGVDIEQTAKTAPEKILKVPVDPLIGVKDYMARYLLSKSGLDMVYFDQIFDVLKKLYAMFCEMDCMLVEVNPLAISKEGRVIALDGKVSVDDSSLYRQPDILKFRDSLQENELVLEARKFNLLYIPCEVKGNIAVLSNGSGMLMSCIDLISKQGMTVGAVLDLGGGATAEKIKEAIRILLSNKRIKALFINIFGGITRCNEVASGIKMAMKAHAKGNLMVIRLEGTHKEKGLEIIKSIKGNVVSVDSLREGVMELYERRDSYEHSS